MEYWQENWETLIERVEGGDRIGVENEKGERADNDKMMNSTKCMLN